MNLNPNLISSDDNSLAGKSIEVNRRNSESRLARLKQIKERANKNKDKTKEGVEIIDQSELNNIFESLEREVLGVKGLFSYEYNKTEKKYYAIYMGVKLNVPIETPEQLISTLNLLDKLIDDNIFKAGKKGKFEVKKDLASSPYDVINNDRLFSATRLINESRLETMTGHSDSPHLRQIHFGEKLAEFLNDIQFKMNGINHIDDVAQYQRKGLPPVQEEKIIPGIVKTERIQRTIPKGGEIKKAKK